MGDMSDTTLRVLRYARIAAEASTIKRLDMITTVIPES